LTDDIQFEVKDRVGTITLNRPEKRNAFTDEMVIRWVAFLDEAARRDDVNVIVFTGAGEAFSSGGDIGGFAVKAERTPLQAKENLWNVTQSLARKVQTIDKPIIAAINGLAVGGGLDVALMCDVRLASDKIRLSETYVKMGLLPGAGGAYFLPRIIGPSAALDMFWTSRFLDAQDALRLGLVNYVYPAEEFRAKVDEYTQAIASAAPLSVRGVKRAVYQGLNIDLATHLDGLSSQLALVRTSEDHKEAVAAFREKRPGVFRGH
jgi:enoyl-CoA hydratase/carnithine racemase